MGQGPGSRLLCRGLASPAGTQEGHVWQGAQLTGASLPQGVWGVDFSLLAALWMPFLPSPNLFREEEDT